jgi:hypothetical protein
LLPHGIVLILLLCSQIALFNDQVKHLATGQFALNTTGLEQLRDQFQRCYAFIRQNHHSTRNPPPNAIPSTSAVTLDTSIAVPNAAQARQDQFVLMAQKNSGLRVEDLKQPPLKHRRTTSFSPNTGSQGSPATLGLEGISPRTPITDGDSPPKEGGRRIGNGFGIGGVVKGMKGKSVLEGLGSTAVDCPSPAAVAEEVLSTKRKRELVEAVLDPDTFIEKTLRGLVLPLGTSFLSSTSSLPPSSDLDPFIPPIHPHDPPTIPSFVHSVPLPAPSAAHVPSPPASAFDFDFYIHPSLFPAFSPPQEVEVDTPELVEDPRTSSPVMDDVSTPMATLLTKATQGTEGVGEGEEDKWSRGDGNLPLTFAWEGDMPVGEWSILSDL